MLDENAFIKSAGDFDNIVSGLWFLEGEMMELGKGYVNNQSKWD